MLHTDPLIPSRADRQGVTLILGDEPRAAPVLRRLAQVASALQDESMVAPVGMANANQSRSARGWMWCEHVSGERGGE